MIKSKSLSKFKDINHGFFNRNGGSSKGIYKSLNCGTGSNDKKKYINKNFKIVSNKIGCSKKRLVTLNQMHSNKFYFINKVPKNKLKGDGLITKKKFIALCILTADCAPVLIYDPINKLIAAAHVGWKGAYKKIIIKIIKRLINIGSKKKDLVVVIGPCIARNSYEVKKDFKNKFIQQDRRNTMFFKNQCGKIYFSLRDYVSDQIVNFGIKKVELIKKDTYIKKNNFFSSRKSKKNKENDYGRNISLIMIK
tara:strand:- start:81 stop:833 length:753 start_codon:yes stop_codon:yes gene_type:complete